MSALLVLGGLALAIVYGMRGDPAPEDQTDIIIAVQPVQSTPENMRLANRPTTIIDQLLSQTPGIHHMPTINALVDMKSGFLPPDCMVLESSLSRYKENYGLHYHLSVPGGKDLNGEVTGINPRILASQMSTRLSEWASVRRLSSVPVR
jgi:hypothetical protein